jgi:hypothetical protein
MAREESSREDLLREATALVERVQLRIMASADAAQDQADQIVVGFRPNGAASFFFGEDPVYQFNPAGELRRAYCDGILIKAIRRRLDSLRRERQPHEVRLLSVQLTDAEQISFTREMQRRLAALAKAIESSCFEITGQVPAEADIVNRVRQWLARHDGLPIAVSPRAG